MFPKEQENYIKSEINKIKDIKLILCLITGLLYWEKELLINMIKEGKIKDFSVLKDTYKHLYYYTKSMNLEYINNSGLWFNEYIKEYKYSKLYNEPNNKLKKILHTKNKNKDTFFEWYYEFETVDTVLDKYEIDNVFWLDAVGCEWTSLIENILQKDFNIYNIKISIGRAKLPTITDYNKYNEYNKYFQDYDKLIHQEYKYPKSFIQEIELISNIIKKLPIEKSKNTAIISDHGTSVFPRLMNKKYNFEKAEHGGRYIFENNIENNTEDYFIYKTDNENKKCIITLNHYSLYKIPKGEVHGGATPEEVLIPIILILNNLYDSYNIHPKKLSIRRRNPCIEINITPAPKINPILKIKNEQIDNKLIYDEKKNVWTTSLETLNAGKYTAEIIIGTFKDKIHIEIKSGLTKTDDFF